MQKGKNDCGLACLSMVAKYLKLPFVTQAILLHSHLTIKGISLYDLSEAARGIGLETLAIRCKVEELGKIPLPAIAFWNGNHFVVVYRVSVRYVWVADPAKGKVRYKKKDFLTGWYQPDEQQGVLLVLERERTQTQEQDA